MDAESSIQVMLFVAAFTTLLMVAIRLVGTVAAKRLPDSSIGSAGQVTPTTSLDFRRLVAILTAAAMEELELDDLYLTSIVELPEPGGPKHWPRVGKMHFFQKSQFRH